jgi:hypothetical protein
MKELIMSDIENSPDTLPDPILVIHEGKCPSLSGRSELTFAIGRHPDGSLHLRIVGNTGGGMWCEEWIEASAIDRVVLGATELTSAAFHVLKPGRSTNTGGFVMAALKCLGLIRTNAENTRLHEHVPTETFEKVAMACIGEPAKAAKTGRRKAKDDHVG